MASRFDVTTTKKWKMDSTKKRLIVEATPTRSGIFLYRNDQGETVRELRHPDEVFSDKTMESLNGIIYTTQKNHVSLMTPENVRERTYGFTLQNAKRVDNHSQIDIKVTDGSEIKAIMGGESLELSNGYSCDVIQESGTFEGEKYDAKQTNIIYDHVARVEKARGGESCRIRLDSDCAISGIEAGRLDSGNNQSTGEEMTEKIKVIQKELPLRESGEFRLDAQEINFDEAQKGVIDTFSDREGKLFSALQVANTSLTEQSVKMDAMKSENETLVKNSEGSFSKEHFDSELQAFVGLHKIGESLKVKDYAKLSPSELGKAVCKASGMYNSEKLDSDPKYLKYSVIHIQEDHTQKVLKSRQNLDNSGSFDTHFDTADNDLAGESELEMA